MRTPHWPLFELAVRTPRLELRYPDDDLALALAELTVEPIHDPAAMPFSIPWTDAPPADLPRNALQHYWSRRATWSPDDWTCTMAVLIDGEPVGMQDAMAKHFPTARQVKTGSWLTQRVQGRGIGKEMRAAVLHLAFAGLGATSAVTAAFDDNLPSQGVTRALGYEPNGWTVELRREQPARMLHYVLTREAWERHKRDDIEILNLEPCLGLFGAS